MIGYVANIEDLSNANANFRRVLYSGSKLQLVVMSVAPGEELDGEIHAEADQFFRIEQGKGRLVIDGVTHKIKPGDCALVPAGAYHNLFCTGHEPLKICTIYGPPHHRDQLVQKTKAEAAESDEAFEAQTTGQAADVVRI
jgi:mannose-6-phosphate isomerase-like protein (cupin superfamily)